jgi:hypothetical protein
VPTRQNDNPRTASTLLPLARAIDDVLARCRSNLSPVNGSSHLLADALIDRRIELASSKPETPLDALVMLASAEAMANVLSTTDLDDLGHDAIHLGATELVLALGNVRQFLEQQAGVTAQTLGINPQGTAWQ